jgi:hypothetical protein
MHPAMRYVSSNQNRPNENCGGLTDEVAFLSELGSF